MKEDRLRPVKGDRMSLFKGIITPMVTPFAHDERQTLNPEGAEKLIERLITHGVHGIFTFGSYGESYSSTPDERIAFSEYTIKQVAGRVPVLVGTGSCSTWETVEMSKRAEAIGADALAVINPYGMKISDKMIATYYERVASAVKIPVVVYNIPSSTQMNISREVADYVFSIDNVKGIKDSSGNMDNLAMYIEAAKGKDVDVLVGSDSKILTALEMGAQGSVAATSNVITDTVVGIYEAWVAGDLETAAKLQADVDPLRDVIHLGVVPQGVKRSLELMGIPIGPGREPALELSHEFDDQVRAMLDHYGIEHE